MISGYGMLAIEDPAPATKAAGEAIATELTGELTPSGSACDGEDDSEGELTRTLSALQRLSVEDQTTLRRKLGAQQQQQSSRCLDDNNRSSSQPGAGGGTKEGKGEQGMAALGVPADSPFRVVLQKAVVESDLEAAKAALRSGADPNERDDLCHSSLHFAAAKGDIGCLRELMQSGARANVANNVSFVFLSRACHSSSLACEICVSKPATIKDKKDHRSLRCDGIERERESRRTRQEEQAGVFLAYKFVFRFPFFFGCVLRGKYRLLLL